MTKKLNNKVMKKIERIVNYATGDVRCARQPDPASYYVDDVLMLAKMSIKRRLAWAERCCYISYTENVANSYDYTTTTFRIVIFIDEKGQILIGGDRVDISGRHVNAPFRYGERAFKKAWKSGENIKSLCTINMLECLYSVK